MTDPTGRRAVFKLKAILRALGVGKDTMFWNFQVIPYLRKMRKDGKPRG